MKIKSIKKLALTMVVALTMGVMSITLSTEVMAIPDYALDLDAWNIYYVPTAPSNVSNQYSYCGEFEYTRNGYYARATSISNEVTISQNSTFKATLDSTTVSPNFKANSYSRPTFLVKASSIYETCYATGHIFIG